jgi:hypothetical protein
MPKVDLGSARAKLRWAREHRNDLEEHINATFENPEYWAILSADLDPESGEHVFRVTDVPDYAVLVEEVSLCVGDVVHALRGALDHLAWQLANAHGSMGDADARRIQFPIHEDLAKFRSNGTARFYHPDDWTQIEEYQPFKGLNGRSDSYSAAYIHQLAHLQELSNTDKHRQLSIVLLTSSRFTTVPVEGGYQPWFVKEDGKWTMDMTKVIEPNPYADPPNFHHSSYLVEVGAEVVRFKMTSELAEQNSIEVAGAVTPSVALAERRPIIPTLDRIAAFVQLILDEFEDHLRKGGSLAAP